MFGLFNDTSVTFFMKISAQGLICVSHAFAWFEVNTNIYIFFYLELDIILNFYFLIKTHRKDDSKMMLK